MIHLELIRRFFFERKLCLVIPVPNAENEILTEIELLKIKDFLSKYDLSGETKMKIYNSQELCRFIISELHRNSLTLDSISRCILNIPISDLSLDDYLKTLLNSDPIKIRILSLLEEECPICYDSGPTYCLECTHVLCRTCCEKVDKCPLCMSPYTMDTVKIKEDESSLVMSSEDSSSEPDITPAKKLKKILILNESEFPSFCMGQLITILSKKAGVLTSIQTDTLFWLITYFESDVVELFQSMKICSEEVRCFIVAILYKIHSNTSLIKYINQPNRIIRFLAVLYTQKDEKYGKPDPHSKKILLKGNRSFRSIILSMVNQCQDSEKTHEEFIRREIVWKLIFKFVHFGEKSNMNKFPIAFKYANSICNGLKIEKKRELSRGNSMRNGAMIIDKWSETKNNFFLYDIENTQIMCTISGKVNKMIENDDESIFDYLGDKPGLTFRILRRLSVKFESSEKLIPFLEYIIPQMTYDQNVDIFHVFSSSDPEKHPSVTVTSKATLHWGKKV